VDETGKGAVIGLFHLRRENAGRKLIIFQVIGNAIAALALPGTGRVSAVATGFIGFHVAFHMIMLPPDSLFTGEV